MTVGQPSGNFDSLHNRIFENGSDDYSHITRHIFVAVKYKTFFNLASGLIWGMVVVVSIFFYLGDTSLKIFDKDEFKVIFPCESEVIHYYNVVAAFFGGIVPLKK